MMKPRIMAPKPLLEGFGLGGSRPVFGDPGAGLGSIMGRPLVQPVASGANVAMEEDENEVAAALQRRARLAHALMEQAARSGQQIGSKWDAINNAVLPILDAVRVKRE